MTAADRLWRELLSRLGGDDDERALAAAAAAVEDWPVTIEDARRANLLGLLAEGLVRVGSPPLPAEALTALSSARAAVARRGLGFVGALMRIVGTLAAHDVPALCYKGPVLSLQAYGDPGLRWSADLDVLVRPGDVDTATMALETIGYAPERGLVEQRDLVMATECEATFVHPGSPPLEIHWRALPGAVNRRLDFDALWPRSQTVTLTGCRVRAPGDPDTLILQAAHGWKHQWLEIEAVVAMANLLARSDAATTGEAMSRAKALHFERRLLLAIAVTERLTSVRAAGVDTADRADAATLRTADRIASLHRSPERVSRERRKLLDGRAGWEARLLDGHLDAALCRAQRVVWPSAVDRQAFHLPPRLWRLYWLARPWRIVRDAGRRRRASRAGR